MKNHHSEDDSKCLDAGGVVGAKVSVFNLCIIATAGLWVYTGVGGWWVGAVFFLQEAPENTQTISGASGKICAGISHLIFSKVCFIFKND